MGCNKPIEPRMPRWLVREAISGSTWIVLHGGGCLTRKRGLHKSERGKGQSQSEGSVICRTVDYDWYMLTHWGKSWGDAIDNVCSWATSGQHATHEHFRVIGTRVGVYIEDRANHPGYHRKCMVMPEKPLNIRSTIAEWRVRWSRELIK